METVTSQQSILNGCRRSLSLEYIHVSIFQHSEEELLKQNLGFDEEFDKKNVTVELPESYTTIFPAKTFLSNRFAHKSCLEMMKQNSLQPMSGYKMFTISVKPWRQRFLM